MRILDLVLGAVGFFGFKVIDKTIIEPLAKKTGERLIAEHLPSACMLLDAVVSTVGTDFDAEAIIRDYLHSSDEEVADEMVDAVVDAVFRVWDLRKVANGRDPGATALPIPYQLERLAPYDAPENPESP